MSEPNAKRRRILIVDDEEILTKTFSMLLERSGYEVYVAKNGQDALTMAGEESFDLVICDIRMPGMNGVETLKAIRSGSGESPNAELPVIFITGFADERTEQEASTLKPAGYLYKPFDNVNLLSLVKETLTDERTKR